MPAGLPRLAGRALLLYRIVWLGTLVAAILVQASAAIQSGGDDALVALGAAQGAVLVAVAAMLFRRRPEDPVAAMLSLAFLIWAITGAADAESASGAWLGALDRLRFLLLVAAVLLFPTGRFEPRWTATALAASFLVFLAGVAGQAGLVREAIFLPPAVLCVAAAIAALVVRLHRTPPCAQRQQLKWVAFGLAGGLALILAYRVGSPRVAAEVHALLLEASFRAGVMLMALGFLVSLLRYRLYDAEAAISRSAAYLALTLSLLAVFAASEATIELIGQRYLGMQVGDLAGGIAAAIAAVLIAPLHERMSQWAEQRFQRDLAVLKEELPGLLADAQAHAGLAELSSIVLPRLEAGVRSTHIALVLDGRVVAVNDMPEKVARDWLEHERAPDHRMPLDRDLEDPLFPLRIVLGTPGGTAVGWVLLGPRPDGSFYRNDELEALAEIAVPLRRAIVAIRERERRSAEARELTESLMILADRVTALEGGNRWRGPDMQRLHRTHSEPEV